MGRELAELRAAYQGMTEQPIHDLKGRFDRLYAAIEAVVEKDGQMARYPFEDDCTREGCGHSSSVHGFDDEQNAGKGVSDPTAQFRCQICGREGCPDMVRSGQNLRDLEKEARL